MTNQAPDQKPPGLLQVVQSVLAAFFGVQSEKSRQRDFTRGKPIHYITIGLVATVVFVLTIVLIVKLVMRQAGV